MLLLLTLWLIDRHSFSKRLTFQTFLNRRGEALYTRLLSVETIWRLESFFKWGKMWIEEIRLNTFAASWRLFTDSHSIFSEFYVLNSLCSTVAATKWKTATIKIFLLLKAGLLLFWFLVEKSLAHDKFNEIHRLLRFWKFFKTSFYSRVQEKT